eukprot:gene5814-6402_t
MTSNANIAQPIASSDSSRVSHDTFQSCPAMNCNWTLNEAINEGEDIPRLPLTSFNHISKEVLDIDNSKRFYMDILGFREIPRPPFSNEGSWLIGYGLNLHLVTTTTVDDQKENRRSRLDHFTTALPAVDHIAFLTFDLDEIRRTLDQKQVYYKHASPPHTGIHQIFLFDPDGNVIEISNCAPPVGETSCLQTEPM